MPARIDPPRPRRLAAALLAAAAALALLAPPPASGAEPAIPAPDGLTEATAAASCWEIAQVAPDAPSGVYWIATPAMGSAQRFYCDQDTDGGGWVLVGRGRQGWSESVLGSGTPAQVREPMSGTTAFTPRQLPGALIDQLNDGRPIADLVDGIRLVRAADAAGTTWQSTTFRLSSPRDTWTWQFNNAQRVSSFHIGGTQGTGGTTASFGTDNGLRRVRTITGAAEGWAMGFGYGSDVRGSTSATSYWWSPTSTTGYARPFTQVFIRPRLLSADVFAPIPAGGTPASAGPAVAQAFAEPQPWGVAGLGAGPASLEGSNEVSAFAESAGRVFVGGNFTTVQRTAGGSGAVAQPYLAAFDAAGAWVPGFRPVFDNQVKAIAPLPGGRVAVGGYFSTVNGASHPGLVVLDAVTGAVDAGFTGALLNFLSGGVPVVRALDVQGDWLYAAGSFTHASSGDGGQVYARGAARFAISTSAPDAWNPEFNGTVISLDASARDDRVYAAGFFSQSKGRAADKAAAMSTTADVALTPWPVVFSNRTGGRQGYQQAVLEVGDRVWLGGSEHSLMSYRRDTLAMVSANITLPGGDFQAIASDGEVVYGGCHCFGSNYEGATAWPGVGTAWTAVEAVYGSGAWSASTGEQLESFDGILNTRGGAGAWALFVDSRGTLWQGGDFSYSTRAGYVRQWSGGFVRHAASDTTSPSTPGALSVTADVDGVALRWTASTDDRAVTGYQVMRADRVVATVVGTTATLPAAPTGTVYAVRAIDAAGNRSASTPATAATTPDPDPDPPALIDAGSTWAYLWSTAPTPAGWAAPGFDDAGWATGTAPVGWGTADIATPLDIALSPRPITSYYRHDIDLPGGPQPLRFTVRVDDGVVVYVNGAEVLRRNIDAGPVGSGTYANVGVSAGPAVASPVIVDVPASAFASGANTIAVEVHSNYRTVRSHSFEMIVATP